MATLEALSSEQSTPCPLHSCFHVHPGETGQFNTKTNSKGWISPSIPYRNMEKGTNDRQPLDLEGEAQESSSAPPPTWRGSTGHALSSTASENNKTIITAESSSRKALRDHQIISNGQSQTKNGVDHLWEIANCLSLKAFQQKLNNSLAGILQWDFKHHMGKLEQVILRTISSLRLYCLQLWEKTEIPFPEVEIILR